MRKWLCAAVALGTLLLTGLISAAPAAAQDQPPVGRDGSFSCRASALRVGPLEPITAGDNTATIDNTTDASDPCVPQAAGLSDYTGPIGCVIVKTDPNCFEPNRVSVGLLYATTEECRPNQGDPAAPNAGPGAELCRSNGAVDLPNTNPREGDGVKARAGVADLFLTNGGDINPRDTPQGTFLHLSAINAFAEVTCRPRNANLPVGRNNPLVPMWDARSQVVFLNLGGALVLDIIPGLIPNGTPTVLNRPGALGPIKFNQTYINNNEPGGPRGPDEGNATEPNPRTGLVDLTQDANPFNEGHDPIFKVTQRAVDISDGAIVAGEATVDAGDLTGRGLITITKDSQPDDDQDFTFRGSPSGPGVVDETGVEPCSPARNRPGVGTFAEFQLDDDEREGPGDRDRDGDGEEDEGDDEEDENGRNGDEDRGDDDVDEDGVGDEDDARLPRSRSFRVQPGTYTVAEAPVEGWDLDQIRCRDNRTPNSRGDVRAGTAMINVDEGERVICTFVNEKERRDPPKCDRDGDGHHDDDKDKNGHDDRDRNRDGRHDHDGRDLRTGRDRDHDGDDDECERDRRQRERDAKARAKKSKAKCAKAVKSKASKKGAAKKACKQKKAKRTKKAAKRTKRNKR